MTNNFFKNNYTAVLGSESGPGPDLGSRSNTGPGPGLEFAGPGPEDWVQGLQKVAGPDLDQTMDSLAPGIFTYLLYLFSIPGQLFRVIIVKYECFINLLCFSYTLNILAASS